MSLEAWTQGEMMARRKMGYQQAEISCGDYLCARCYLEGRELGDDAHKAKARATEQARLVMRPLGSGTRDKEERAIIYGIN